MNFDVATSLVATFWNLKNPKIQQQAEMDQPKRKYVCKDCDEFSTDDRASLDVHYNFEHELIVELSYLEPEVILEELDGQVNLKPGKHRCNQACDFSTDTRQRLDVHLCIEHDVYR